MYFTSNCNFRTKQWEWVRSFHILAQGGMHGQLEQVLPCLIYACRDLRQTQLQNLIVQLELVIMMLIMWCDVMMAIVINYWFEECIEALRGILMGIKSMDFDSTLPRLKFQVCYLLSMWLWARYLICLSFFISKVKIIIVPTS